MFLQVCTEMTGNYLLKHFTNKKNWLMKTQPIGASGQKLGATSVVAIETVMEQTGQKLVIHAL